MRKIFLITIVLVILFVIIKLIPGSANFLIKPGYNFVYCQGHYQTVSKLTVVSGKFVALPGARGYSPYAYGFDCSLFDTTDFKTKMVSEEQIDQMTLVTGDISPDGFRIVRTSGESWFARFGPVVFGGLVPQDLYLVKFPLNLYQRFIGKEYLPTEVIQFLAWVRR